MIAVHHFVVSESDDNLTLERKLRREILFARQHVYQIAAPTPLECLPEDSISGVELWVKREDLSPIKAYKWRGAFNKMAQLSQAERVGGVVTASAGNHAQGVALAANHLSVEADIVMPRSTPVVKRQAVRRLGGQSVRIILRGDSYDDAFAFAQENGKQTGRTYIHAYDDLHVIAGQGTLADEIVMSGQEPFDRVYLQIGGGGMAGGVACWLKMFWPDVEIVGVEGEGQASMKKALEEGKPVRLDYLDIFCDGTAVRKAGELPFQLARTYLDRMLTVSNDEVCQAIRTMWEGLRCIPEPSGAMGLAAALKEQDINQGKKVLVILCGANLDFVHLASIAGASGIAGEVTASFRIHIPETPGSMLKLLDSCFNDLNIVDFQYGKRDPNEAWPVFGISTTPGRMSQFQAALTRHGFEFKDVTGSEDVQFRVIPYQAGLLGHPLFLNLEFYERAGALHDFLSETIRGKASFCYFNYRYSGERVGRALIGLEFDSAELRHDFLALLKTQGEGFRRCQEVDPEVMARLL